MTPYIHTYNIYIYIYIYIYISFFVVFFYMLCLLALKRNLWEKALSIVKTKINSNFAITLLKRWKKLPFSSVECDESHSSNICTLWYVTCECIDIHWVRKHRKKVRCSKASISINSSNELSKMQFFLWLSLRTPFSQSTFGRLLLDMQLCCVKYIYL